jgi:hypothetical protein
MPLCPWVYIPFLLWAEELLPPLLTALDRTNLPNLTVKCFRLGHGPFLLLQLMVSGVSFVPSFACFTQRSVFAATQ